ncbi:MAG: hypothetical protein DDG59_01690 [Anaerolineae bacterium]|nr:MAG: hypothetical protein DDG59_01690 [Anaerolineae bacterium]
MDGRFLFPEAHILQQLLKRLYTDFPFNGNEVVKEIFDSLEDILVIVDQDTLIHYANQTARQRFNLSTDSLLGKTLFELMPFPQVEARWNTILNALERYGKFSFIDRGHGTYALTHIFPFRPKGKTKEYYLIFTQESVRSPIATLNPSERDSSSLTETLLAVQEDSGQFAYPTPLQDHLRISLALADAATGASLAEDLTTALNTLCTQACRALEAPAAVIRLYNRYQDTLEIGGSYGLDEEHLRRNFAIAYAPLAYLASETAPRVFVADLSQSPPTPADQLPYRSQLAASVIANIVRNNRFLGVLIILIPQQHPPITKEDLLFVQAIAEQASITIDRFSLMKLQERRTRELENLVRIGIELREVLTKRDVLVTLLDKLMEDDHIALGAVYLLQDQRYQLVSCSGSSFQPPQWLAIPMNAWRESKPLFFERICHSTNLLLEGKDDLTPSDKIQGIAIPLHTPAKTYGVILLFFPYPIRLSSDDQHKIYLFQEIGNAALHRADAMENLEQMVLERTRELSILYEVTAYLNAPSDLRQAVAQVLDNVQALSQCQWVAVHLYHPKSKQLALYQEKSVLSASFFTSSIDWQQPPWKTVFEQNAVFHLDILPQGIENLVEPSTLQPLCYLGLPIRSKGEALGVLSLVSNNGQQYSLNDQAILTAIADQLGLAIERVRLIEKGEEVAKLEERQRLARELHDALTQSLYSMTLLTSGYKRSLHHASVEEIHQWMDELNEIAQNALAELRLLLYELRPTALEQDGLHGALKRRLEAVEKRAGIRTTFEVHGSFRLPPEDEEHFYRIAQEALNNALQHAHHQSILVQIESLPNFFRMTIADDGIGFDFDQVAQHHQHSGLSNMLSRARQVEAQLSIETSPGKGTKLLITKEYHNV